jgi:hypothetical protein
MFLEIIWIVLMILWLFFGCYFTYDRTRPYGLGNTVIPWICVAILGYAIFSGGMLVVAR